MQAINDQFLLDPSVHFLNFGSYGACPRPIFENYQYWQKLLEFEPVQFIKTHLPVFLAESRSALAAYIDVPDSDDLVFITNPTFAVNLIAKNLDLQPGDEILAPDIEYGACDRTWHMYCNHSGAIYQRQKVNFPITDKAQFINDFVSGFNSRTKAVFISHITSATALILPVKEIIAIAKAKGVITIVDGAHAPGQIPLSMKELDPDFYTGACHKWMLAPKGCSFLYARKSKQPLLKEPMVVSWGYQAIKPSASQFLDYNQLIGTRDMSAFLTAKACIDFMEKFEWKSRAAECRKMVTAYAPLLYDLLETKPISPVNEEWIGQMISIPVRTSDPDELQKKLFNDFKVEVPVMVQGDTFFIRYSINAFNTTQNLDALYDALKMIKNDTKLIH